MIVFVPFAFIKIIFIIKNNHMGNSNKYLYLYMWAFFVIALQFSTLGSLIPIFATKLGI